MHEPLPGVVVRIVDRADVPAVAELRSLWSAGTAPDRAFEERLGDWVASEGDRRTTWIAWAGDLAVGMASMLEYRRMPHPGRPDSRWGYISNMFVRSESRDRGIGSMLLEALIAAARERGYVRLVLSPSERSLSLYQRAGFTSPDQTAGAARLLVRLGES